MIECATNSTVESGTIIASTLFLVIIFTISKCKFPSASVSKSSKDELESQIDDFDNEIYAIKNINDKSISTAEETPLLKGILSKKIYL